MKRSPGARKAADFFGSIYPEFNKSALAAVVTALSLLALTRPSEARIVYTPANIEVGPNQNYNLGTLAINNFSGVYRSIVAKAATGGGVVGNGEYAAALSGGAVIGPLQTFIGPDAFMVLCKSSCRGDWVDVYDRYLGVEFQIKGETHYGWARLSTTICICRPVMFDAFLTGYAYETIPGKTIIAGQTMEAEDDPAESPGSANTKDSSSGAAVGDLTQAESLGMIAPGARDLPLWRREEPVPDSR